jgi:hypothetical protein
VKAAGATGAVQLEARKIIAAAQHSVLLRKLQPAAIYDLPHTHANLTHHTSQYISLLLLLLQMMLVLLLLAVHH